MPTTKLDVRQALYRNILQQTLPFASSQTLDNILSSIDQSLTLPLDIDATNPASLVVNVKSNVVSNTESDRNSAMPFVGALIPSFASGTVTFPSSSGGNVTTSTGQTAVLTCPSGNYVQVLLSMDQSGNIIPVVGSYASTAASALVPAPNNLTLPFAYVLVYNPSGTIQNISQNAIYQFSSVSTYQIASGSAPSVTTYTSGSGSYSVPAGALYLKVRIVGGGGGGGGAGSAAITGGNGVATNLSGLVAGPGAGGTGGTPSSEGSGGVGGGVSFSLGGGTFTSYFSQNGATGQGGFGGSNSGGVGGNSPFAGAGGGQPETNGTSATGFGSGGGGASGPGFQSAGGGGAAGYIEGIITNITAPTFSYSIGGGGGGGVGSVHTGGAGASGAIIIEAYF